MGTLARKPITSVVLALALGGAVSGCAKLKQKDSAKTGNARVEAKRHQAACASPKAYDRLKGVVFDQAIGQRNGDRANLDALADYSLVRMEQPIVDGWDPDLDVTRCTGRFILEIPPGAERGLSGERRLQAEIRYTAQPAADGSGLVYQINGAQPIVAKLAAFNVPGLAYRPPPAIDEPIQGPTASVPTAMAQADVPLIPTVARRSEPSSRQRIVVPPPVQSAANEQPIKRAVLKPQPTKQAGLEPPLARKTASASQPTQRADLDSRKAIPVSTGSETGESTVRAFYEALGQGNGAAASGRVIPEKRSSRAFSSNSISRFYGRLPEPIRLTGIAPIARGTYRVSYRYSTGRSHCNGNAIVKVANNRGSDLISSIRALSGC